MKHGASYAIEIEQEQVTLETIKDALNKYSQSTWEINDEKYKEKTVLANPDNPIIVYFQTGNGCILMENYNTKTHKLIDLLPEFTSDVIAQLINIQLKRMGI